MAGSGDGAEVMWLAPVFEIVEVDVGGEVDVASVLVEVGAGKAILQEVTAQGSGEEARGGGGVVDGEKLPLVKAGEPCLEPLVVAFVDFDALAGGVVLLEEEGVGELFGWEEFFLEMGLGTGEMEFGPC